MSEAELLTLPGFDAAKPARADIESGLVDARLVDVLTFLAMRHRIHVSLVKTGHPMGERSPAGRENDHFFYRAADIPTIDDVNLGELPRAPGAVAVGRLLMALRGAIRPTRIMGPAPWLAALGEGDRSGFRDDAFATANHADHLHIGFSTRVSDTPSRS